LALHIDYYISLNSPWTHLGAGRLEAMAVRHRASVRIFPVDFGSIFPASGGLPLPKRAPERQAYRLMELERWRKYLGVPIQIKPKFFPANEAAAARCVIAARETMGDAPAIALAHRVLKALWEEEQDTGDPATLAQLIAELGLDAPALTRLAAEDRWAERRTRDTKDALARGVFGAPSYVIDDESSGVRTGWSSSSAGWKRAEPGGSSGFVSDGPEGSPRRAGSPAPGSGSPRPAPPVCETPPPDPARRAGRSSPRTIRARSGSG
jgi:2-hydroxychromene-2-carboxylate isomerase